VLAFGSARIHPDTDHGVQWPSRRTWPGGFPLSVKPHARREHLNGNISKRIRQAVPISWRAHRSPLPRNSSPVRSSRPIPPCSRTTPQIPCVRRKPALEERWIETSFDLAIPVSPTPRPCSSSQRARTLPALIDDGRSPLAAIVRPIPARDDVSDADASAPNHRHSRKITSLRVFPLRHESNAGDNRNLFFPRSTRGCASYRPSQMQQLRQCGNRWHSPR